MGVIVLLLLLLVDLSCGTQAAATISMGNPHQVGPASESWTATCIASDLPSSQSSSGYSVIGGYLSVDADTAHFKVIKRNVDDGRILWIQTIEAAPGRKNLVLSCTIDSAGDVYVATASNDPMYGGVGTIGTGRYGLFLSKLSGCDGSNVWKQALNRTSNGAGDSLDIAWNPIKNEVVLFGQVHRFDIIVPALNRYNATSGILLDDMSHLFEPDGVTITIASRVVVDLSGTIFVALRIPNLNYIERSCPAADCSICLIEKIGSWRVQTSSNYNCSSVTLAVDRFSNNLVVYMDGIDSNMQQVSLIAKVRNVNYPEKPVPELNEIVPATTQIGAVFAYNGIVLVSGVTTRDLNPGQESLDGNGECFKEPRSSFIAMLNQTGGISEARYLARIDGESIPLEMRSSGMAWSTHASKLLVLTREYDDDKNIETAVWAPIEVPDVRIARIPTFTTFTETCSLTEVTTARLSPSTSPNPAPNGPDVSESLLASPLIWIAICLVLLLVIGIAYGVIYVRRRAFKRRMSDKEHQSKTGSRSAAYQSSAALIRSSNVLAEHVPEQAAISTLASVESKPPVPQRPALDSSSVRLVRKDSGLSLYKSSSRPDIPPVVAPTDFGLPTYKATTRPSIAPGISSNKLIGSPSAKSLSRIGGSMTDGKPTSNNPSDQSVMGSQRTLVAAESVIKMGTGAHRPGDYPLVVRPTKTSTLSRKGNTTIGASSLALSLKTTIVSDQKAIAIPGFLELLDNVDFTVGKELARGGGGSVHLGLAINTETIRLAGAKQIVVKRVFENTSDKDESANTFFQEVAVMWLLNSGRNIAKIAGYCRAPKAILMKFYPCGSLSDLIHSQAKKPKLAPFVYNDRLAVRLATDVACGVTDMHREGLFHSDLKPPNILLDIDEHGVLFAVITDFGVTQVVKECALLVKAFRVSTAAGASPCYAAPELMKEQVGGMKSAAVQQTADTFSFAVILAELITRTVPWKFAKRLDDVMEGVVAGQRGFRRPLNFGAENYHHRVANLVERGWDQAPRARPEMSTIHRELEDILRNMSEA